MPNFHPSKNRHGLWFLCTGRIKKKNVPVVQGDRTFSPSLSVSLQISSPPPPPHPPLLHLPPPSHQNRVFRHSSGSADAIGANGGLAATRQRRRCPPLSLSPFRSPIRPPRVARWRPPIGLTGGGEGGRGGDARLMCLRWRWAATGGAHQHWTSGPLALALDILPY